MRRNKTTERTISSGIPINQRYIVVQLSERACILNLLFSFSFEPKTTKKKTTNETKPEFRLYIYEIYLLRADSSIIYYCFSGEMIFSFSSAS